MAEIIKFKPKEEKKESKMSDEGMLNLLRAIYENDEDYDEETEIIEMPNAYKLSKYDECYRDLRRMGTYSYIQELDEYIKQIDFYVSEFEEDALKLEKDEDIEKVYNEYRQYIIDTIVMFIIEFCDKYNYPYRVKKDGIVVHGINFKFDSEFSLERMYNDLVNIALLMDEVPRR